MNIDNNEKYSEYNLDQLISIPKYQELCNLLLDLANDNITKDILKSILYEGGYKDLSVSSKICTNDNPKQEMNRRLSIAYLLITNPNTFYQIIDNKINLFHGTNSSNIPSILKNGLLSYKEAKNNNISIISGEEWSRINNERNFISFTDVLPVAEEYSHTITKSEESEEKFPIIIGTTVDDLKEVGYHRIDSDITEVTINKKLPLKNIKVIFIPTDKLEIAKRLINNKDIIILPMDILSDEVKFYYIEDLIINIDYKKYEELKYKLKRKNKKNQLLRLKQTITEKLLFQKTKRTK